jgi:DNA-binding transcriptional LysR family regulator
VVSGFIGTPMRLRHIEVFHAVYTCGSITAAAKFLQVSQPSVSKVLAHAEQQLGYALFDRIKGKIVPTREAERLIGLVSGVYQSIDELKQVSANLGTPVSGRIRVAVTPAFGIDLVPAAIAGYLEQYPEIRFEVETLHFNQVVRALNQSRIDLGLAFHPSTVPGIISEKISPAEFVVVSREKDGQENSPRIRLEKLTHLPFIGLSIRGPLGQRLNEELKAAGIEMRSSVSAETYQMAFALVAHGYGVAIVDEITAHSMDSTGLLIQGLDPPLYFDMAILHSEEEPLSILNQRFAIHLAEQVQGFLRQHRRSGSNGRV